MTTQLISPELITKFNQAAGLAREGDFEASLRAWDELLAGTPGAVLTGDFLGQAYLRKAWVLMDLGRFTEARTVLQDDVMQACLGQFSMTVLYEYYFSYANTLGNLRDINAMDEAFGRAMNIAAEHIGDTARLHHCWHNLLTWAEAAGAWEYLLREVETCILYADKYDAVLAELARLFKAMGFANVGRKIEAAEIVNPTMQAALQGGEHAIVARCRAILDA